MSARPIVFLSDFGLDDEFVGVCHGVMFRLSPETHVIDLTHGIPPQDVLRGALVLAEAVQFMPERSVYLAVVDPGVGTSRKPIAVRSRARALLVGPDNGVLSLALEALGGAWEAVQIDSDQVVLPSVSRTFHGRDVFAPAAAHLSRGMALEKVGSAIDPGSLVAVETPAPDVHPGRIHCQVLGIDRFGNIQINVREGDLAAAELDQGPVVTVRTVWRALPVPRATTFGEVRPGEFAAVFDSRGWLALAKNGGSAAGTLRLGLGDPVVIEAPG